MALTGLSTFTPEEFQEAIKDKDPVKVRIMLFYDGTLNNRDNIEQREKYELDDGKNDIEPKKYKKYTKDSANSYDNGRTNIAIMEPHVSEKKEDYADYDAVYKHYIPGQGALTHEKDSLWGYALAIGESGVPSRAEEGIRKAVDSIFNDNKKVNPLRHYIEKLTIDVFGFSRGAATARYAIHVIHDGKISWVDDDTGEVIYEWDPVFNRLNTFNYGIKKEAVEVGFAGLYDTVLSYIGSQMLSWSANTLKQKAVARAKKALHLAAADEHRYDFPLHKIKSALDKGIGEEYYLPGVHSDIGGSYNQANELKLERQAKAGVKEEEEEEEEEYMRPSDEGTSEDMIINEGEPDKMAQDRQDLINQGWYTEKEIEVVDVAWDDYFRDPIRSVLKVERQGISSAYSNIPLKIMARYARGEGVELIIDDKLEDRADIILDPDLKKFAKKLDDYIASHKNTSKPEDWVGENAFKAYPELKDIRHKHFHFSASKMSAGYKPNFEWDKAKNQYIRKRYYYNA